MSDSSHIQWCEATWNFLIGCTKVSAGCMRCYAIRVAWRLMHNPNPKIAKKFAGTVRRDSKGELNWTGRINFDEDTLALPLKWRLPRRIFVNSLSDLFHPNVKDEWIDEAFAVMALCPQHTFQILTKHPDRMCEWSARNSTGGHILHLASLRGDVKSGRWPLPNVQFGTSIENQKEFLERQLALRSADAAVRFFSLEPLLGPIDVKTSLTVDHYYCDEGTDEDPTPAHRCLPAVDWVIVGGESGPGARKFNVEWARTIIADCKAAGVPVFVKQLGAEPFEPSKFARTGDAGLNLKNKKGGDMSEWSEDLRVREFPETKAVAV